jgi:peptidoglycan hydrolase-like protein with peptidoglycan-binding domain
VAEDIRMDGAKSAVDNSNNSDVDRFNAMVADYNSRCSSFRYRRGSLESVRRDIEPYRSQLQAEGRSRFARSPSTGSLSTPAPARPAPDATVQAIQRKLNELGYEAGSADGLMGRGTRSAILAFQRDMGLTQDGLPDRDLLAVLNSVTSATTSSNTARPNREYAPEQSAALPPRPTPDPLPPRQVQTAPASRDAKNFSVCGSGQYPSLCNYALLTPDEKVQVAAAERRVNFQTCASGNYPSLCKRSLLTPEETTQVAAAERRVNLQTCMSGNYPSLCKRNLLTPDEAVQVAAAERRVNFQTCVSGNYPSLCKHSLLTSDEAAQVAAAEGRVNFQTCISGQYPSLCRHSLLTSDEAARVADAERRAANR